MADSLTIGKYTFEPVDSQWATEMTAKALNEAIRSGLRWRCS